MSPSKLSQTPRDFHTQAIAAERAGDLANAMRIMAEGLAAHPQEAALSNSAGSLALRAGQIDQAARYFATALDLDPGNLEFAINGAIALDRLGQSASAARLLAGYEEAGASIARYWSVRGTAHRNTGDLAQAAEDYERCLALEPRHPRALHGRARIALDRAEHDALARFDRGLAVNPGEPDLWLGKAQALDLAGDTAGARSIMEQVATQAPGWIEGLKFLAQLRYGAGETDWTKHYADAAKKHPQDPNIPAAHADVLAGLDFAGEAADVAARARKTFPDQPHFAFLEAIHAGSDGQWERAEAIFSGLELESDDRFLHEARHHIRAGDAERAESLLERVLQGDPWSISAWALRGIAWRMMDDTRADWLHGQEGLVQRLALSGDGTLIERVTAHLRALHDGMPTPLGQSLRGGSQTRGHLFDRADLVIQELREAILATLEVYRTSLPASDQTHPLLRHRETEIGLAGSWSVRLTGGGDYHTSHIHPQGVVSSALYLVIPRDAAGPEQHGWLEVGRPPPDLGLSLPPLETVQPEPGYLALFPSTLYHGTTPFGDAERMTVAFDAVPMADSLA